MLRAVCALPTLKKWASEGIFTPVKAVMPSVTNCNNEFVYEGGRRMLHAGQVDVARRLAAGAPDLEPGKSAVDGLVGGRRRIDRFAVGPHPLVPAFAEQSVGLLQHGLCLGPADCAARMPVIARTLPSSLFRALR